MAENNTQYKQPEWNWYHEDDEWKARVKFVSLDENEVLDFIPDTITHEADTYTATIQFDGVTYQDQIVVLNNQDGISTIMRDTAEIENPDEPVSICVPETDQSPDPINSDSSEEIKQEESVEEPEHDKWEGLTDKEINNALKQITEQVKMIEQIWKSDQQEYEISESHIRQLYKFNEDHRDPMPGDLDDEERSKWNHFNGLHKLTEEDVENIFGKEHPIIGVAHTQTLDRIDTVVGDFFSWTYVLNQYKQIYNAYQEYIEEQEEANIQALRDAIKEEPDPEKQKEMEKIIDFYYYRKHLGFLCDVDDKTKKRIASAWKDKDKLNYWINRSREKLEKLKISSKIILEISNFEKRFMEPKYHRISNILLTYFLNLSTYCRPDNKEDENRNMVVCMVFALDSLIRKTASAELTVKLMTNIETFENQMLEIIPDTRDMSELEPTERPAELAGDFTNAKVPDGAWNKPD